jgi:hypothetical protein
MVGLASRRTAVATWKMKLSSHLRVAKRAREYAGRLEDQGVLMRTNKNGEAL